MVPKLVKIHNTTRRKNYVWLIYVYTYKNTYKFGS